MKAIVAYQIEVEVEMPDDFPERTRQLAREWGENGIAVDASNLQVMERTGLIRGVRGFDHDEAMLPSMSEKVRVRVLSEEVTDSRMVT